MAQTPEGRVKDKIKAVLKKHGAYFFMPVQNGYGTQTVDFLCCVKGRFLAIEAKAPGKKPTGRQEDVLAEVMAAGGTAIWLDDKVMEVEQLERILQTW